MSDEMAAGTRRVVLDEEPSAAGTGRNDAPAWFDQGIRQLVGALIHAKLRFAPKEPLETARVWVRLLWLLRTWKPGDMRLLGLAAAGLAQGQDDFPTPNELMDRFRQLQAEEPKPPPATRPRLPPRPPPSAESLRARLARHPPDSPFRRLAEALLDGPAELAGARAAAVLAELKQADRQPPETPAPPEGEAHDTP